MSVWSPYTLSKYRGPGFRETVVCAVESVWSPYTFGPTSPPVARAALTPRAGDASLFEMLFLKNTAVFVLIIRSVLLIKVIYSEQTSLLFLQIFKIKSDNYYCYSCVQRIFKYKNSETILM